MADIGINLAVCLSAICNIVSILKFGRQLSLSNERVGIRDETRQAAFLRRKKKNTSVYLRCWPAE
jgi:hypothetical protein